MERNQDLAISPETVNASASRMPALFVGHGSPMNAIEDNQFGQKWAEIGRSIPKPTAILSISAHWETHGSFVTAMNKPKTIHDFGGFPRQLFEYEYPASGSLELAETVQQIAQIPVKKDLNWGLDHGTWSVLAHMYPLADVPVVQLSMDKSQLPAFHYDLGKQLSSLRDKGVLIIGSGNIVHNLGMASFSMEGGHAWAEEFDEIMKQLILSADHEKIINYQTISKTWRLAIPTNEHYLPLLYILGLQDQQSQVTFFNEQLVAGALSMRSVILS